MAKNKLTDEEKKEAENYFNSFKYQSYSKENEGKITVSHQKILTFAQGDPKKRAEELGAVDMETDETFEVDLI